VSTTGTAIVGGAAITGGAARFGYYLADF